MKLILGYLKVHTRCPKNGDLCFIIFMIQLFTQFLEHHNKWTHSRKPINMVFQNRFYFLDISGSCWILQWIWKPFQCVVVIMVKLLKINLLTYTTIYQQLDKISRKLNLFWKTILICFREWVHLLWCCKKCLNNDIMNIVLFKNLILRFNISEVRVMNSRHYYMTG